MKISKTLTITAMALALSFNSFALAETKKQQPTNLNKVQPCFSVAVIDVQKLVDSSPKINAAKAERKAKIEELAKYIDTARANVLKETSEAKKKSMEESYNKEINDKKDAIEKEYAKKLTAIDKEITASIKAKAKQSKFDLVLSKSSVLDGGTDITSEIVKGLK